MSLLACIGMAATPGAAPADDVAPSYTVNEPAIATAKPSVIYFEQTYTGYLRDKATGSPLSYTLVAFAHRCSGVMVNADGYVVTTAGCVRPSTWAILTDALYQLGRRLTTEGSLAADQLDLFVADRLGTTVLTGPDRGSLPGITLFAQFDIATPNVDTAPAMAATVIPTLAATDGSLALVQVNGSNLPTVELNTDPLRPGTSVVALGFGKGGTPETADRFTVHGATVSVTEPTGTNRLGINGELGPTSLGGPVIDVNGRLVALLDADRTTPGQPNHDLLPSAEISRFLGLHGVSNRLTEVDESYRTALSSYFDGQFSRAVTQFDEVLGRAPTRDLAKMYRYQAQRRLTLGGDSVDNTADWPLYLLSTIAGVFLVGAMSLGWEVVERNFSPTPSEERQWI